MSVQIQLRVKVTDELLAMIEINGRTIDVTEISNKITLAMFEDGCLKVNDQSPGVFRQKRKKQWKPHE